MLDSTSIKILRFIKEKSVVDVPEIIAFIGNEDIVKKTTYFLKDNNYIKGTIETHFVINNEVQWFNHPPYELTPMGKAYLEQTDKELKENLNNSIHNWTNTIIAALALIVAIIALFK